MSKKKSFIFPQRLSCVKFIPSGEHTHTQKKRILKLNLMTLWIHMKWDNIYVSNIQVKQ